MQYRLNTKKPHLLSLILLISFPSVATVLISPALPAIGDFFVVSNGKAQQLITLFIIGYAIGQLIYSPFANRYGRKIAVYLGIAVYILSCIVCLVGIYIHSFDVLLIGRFLMALGSAVGMIISFTIINDFYFPEQARPVVSYTVLAYAFMPALAVFLGGIITSHISWIACFYFYLIYGGIILLTSAPLPETLQRKSLDALQLKPLLHSYSKAFKNLRLIIFSLIYGLMASFVYIVSSGAPFIAIDEIGLTPGVYGALLLIPYCGQLIGALTSGRISKHLSSYKVITIGYSSTILGTLFMFICFVLGWINTFSLMAPIFFIMMGLPMVYSSVTVMALVGYEDKATGSAVMSFTTMTVTFITTVILTLLPTRHALVMPSLFVFVLILAVIVVWQAWIRFKD
ncbi:MFS transporter [Candidiatus Paracoxiella cheracis]|uniref:MFS transporter n=1 Tax=Candidiatus Paracoxiella cheracis TaxID=3405120 RepID=UPI003BF52270